MTRRNLLITAGALPFTGTATAFAARAESDRWEVRERASGREIRWRDFPGRLKTADVIFVGEQHDDPQTHRVEHALLERLHPIFGSHLTLGMEMFERDQQASLDRYLSGGMDAAAFGKAVKLWPNYETDYRPLVEFAKTHQVPVIGTNAPQRMVRQVGKEGLSLLAKLLPEEKKTVASFVLAPEGDEYHRRFADVIGEGHGEGEAMDAGMIRRFYEAQCLRDDTMAETISRQREKGQTVLHINGAFHSDHGYGTVARLRWRRPLDTHALISVIPVRNREDRAIALKTTETMAQADYVIFVPDERPKEKNEGQK
jgi:uncharacterized iron-regulated protein